MAAITTAPASIGEGVSAKAGAASFAPFAAKMDGMGDAAIAAFRKNFMELVGGGSGMIPEGDVRPAGGLPTYDSLKGAAKRSDVPALLEQTAVIKLNGGLGTSMGLEKAKSLLKVRDGMTFLDLIGKQVESTREAYSAPNLRFLLMNSFSTSDDTKAHLAKAFPALVKGRWELLQNKSPKVDKATMTPALYPSKPDLEWCPPGHGDIYAALLGTGTLDALLAEGVKYLFVSNSDNLGATLDLDLLAYFAETGAPFLMEVCERTESDKKGGHLAVSNATNGLILRESAQCPKEDEKSFQDVSKHRFFNTNNLWVNLEHLSSAMRKHGGLLPLPTIFNEKTVNPRDKKTAKVYQLETAMGSAIACFDNASAVVVPRTRFAPVKTCGDLFVLRSDAYQTLPDARVQLADGVAKAPVVKLDDDHYKLVDKLEALVSASPSLVSCSGVTVKGPVRFLPGTTLKGKCVFTNNSDTPVDLPAKAYANVDLDLTPSGASSVGDAPSSEVPTKVRARCGCVIT